MLSGRGHQVTMAVAYGKGVFQITAVSFSRRWNVSVVLFLLLLTCLSFLRMTVVQQQLTVITRVFASRCKYQATARPKEPGYCPPTTNVFFLKTHKCASSTVQNILMRFGDTRNLSFLLPKDQNYIGHPEPFSMSMLSPELTPSIGFNIFCHHTRFQRYAIRSVLPFDAVFVTIFRSPVSLFESLYGYYQVEKHTGMTLAEFAEGPWKNFEWLKDNRYADKIGRNQMLFDLGYNEGDWSNSTRLMDIIQEVEESFDLVMIAELFDESLILLKHRLCWSTEDIIYFTHNQRTRQSVVRLSPAVQERLLKFNSADQRLYDHFYRKIQRMIDQFGRERMKEEVRNLRLWNKLWYDHCVDGVEVSSKTLSDLLQTYSDHVYSFVLKDKKDLADICFKLATAELPYTEKLRSKQKELTASTSPDTPCLVEIPVLEQQQAAIPVQHVVRDNR